MDNLDGKFPLTPEVLPEARLFVPARILQIFAGSRIQLRLDEKTADPPLTSNGNLLFDLWFASWPPLEGINATIKDITGIVETSLFFGMASKAIVADDSGVTLYQK